MTKYTTQLSELETQLYEHINNFDIFVGDDETKINLADNYPIFHKWIPIHLASVIKKINCSVTVKTQIQDYTMKVLSKIRADNNNNLLIELWDLIWYLTEEWVISSAKPEIKAEVTLDALKWLVGETDIVFR